MNDFLKSILDLIYGLIGNYGWSIVFFTLFIRLCLMPLDYKSRKGMRKMSSLMPKQKELQKKYGHDQDKLNRKMQELYKKEGASPMAGCWPMLLSMPILFAMFGALRYMANEQLARQAFEIVLDGAPTLEPFLWLKNLWMPDSPFAASWPNLQSIQMVEEKQWLNAISVMLESRPTFYADLGAAIGIADLSAESFVKGSALQSTITALGNTMQGMEGYLAATGSYSWMTIPLIGSVSTSWNGLFILPVLSAVSQLLMTKVTETQSTPAPAANDEKAQAQQSTSKFMKWFFPFFSLWLCLSYTASFALYWVVSNVIHIVMNQGINWHLDRKEKEAAQKPAVDKGNVI